MSLDFRLIDLYLAGEASAEERRQVESDPDAMAVVRGARNAPQPWDTSAAWKRVRPRAAFPWLRIAALLVVAIGAAVLFYSPRSSPSESIASTEYRTTAGERRTVTLADGSKVVLAPNTTLRVPVEFRGARDVHLAGEAFFDVAHDLDKPFIVHTRTANTQVMGTAFNVRAYPGDLVTEVALQRGKVGVRPVDSDIVVLMEPGQVVRSSNSAAAYDTTSIDVAALTSWASGQLAFTNWTLESIIDRLDAWYGVDIGIADPELARTRVTAYLPAGTLDEVLAAISEVAGATVQRSGNAIALSRR